MIGDRRPNFKFEHRDTHIFLCISKFCPGVYDDSGLPLTDLERGVLRLRSEDKVQETVSETVRLIESNEVNQRAGRADALSSFLETARSAIDLFT